jgi:CDP-glucose 4,6-dehydratase
MLLDLYRSRRVLVTGHTGFKGGWLSEWLLSLGADVTGFSLPPPTQPALFEQLSLARRVRHMTGDVRDLSALAEAVVEAQPDFVFHLAAQPLVRASYDQPVETYATNVLGTVHLLEAVRLARRPCVVVIATSDKCYENHGRDHAYAEDEPLGGHDPYSSSKACAEIITSAYRRSFFSKTNGAIRVATARAGNVIGGGDWAADRIVPDCVRNLQRREPIAVRNPRAIRPWQHVLEPIAGYLVLGAHFANRLGRETMNDSVADATAFNFGPDEASHRPVADLVDSFLKHWPGMWVDRSQAAAPHEAGRLKLSIQKAADRLEWRPVWGFERAIAETAAWYQRYASSRNPFEAHREVSEFTRAQIQSYIADARRQNLPWAYE